VLAGVPLIDLVGVVGAESVRRVVVFEYHHKRSLPNGLMSDIMEGGHFDECTVLRSARVAIRHPSESDGASEFHRRRRA
jgi:hypothetical protein